jgi:hypothetical protein
MWTESIPPAESINLCPTSRVGRAWQASHSARGTLFASSLGVLGHAIPLGGKGKNGFLLQQAVEFDPFIHRHQPIAHSVEKFQVGGIIFSCCPTIQARSISPHDLIMAGLWQQQLFQLGVFMT